jgi:hypothetical protein
MICRIQYDLKTSKGELKSLTIATPCGKMYYALLNYEKGYWKILNAKRRNVVRQGLSMNKNVLRRSVRRELIKLGVKLEKEFKESGYAKTKAS